MNCIFMVILARITNRSLPNCILSPPEGHKRQWGLVRCLWGPYSIVSRIPIRLYWGRKATGIKYGSLWYTIQVPISCTIFHLKLKFNGELLSAVIQCLKISLHQFLHMPWQLSCRVMCKIWWQLLYIWTRSKWNFFWIWIASLQLLKSLFPDPGPTVMTKHGTEIWSGIYSISLDVYKFSFFFFFCCVYITNAL